MQTSTYALKGGYAFGAQDQRVKFGFGELGKKSSRLSNLCLTNSVAFCGLRFRSAGLPAMEELGHAPAKFRSVKAQASADGDREEFIPAKAQGRSSGTVLPYVGVACLGAILFGYHLGVVNGALEYLSKDLGIVENTVSQGWIVSMLLTGATVGSFTGGALADKFGRTR